MVLSSRETLGSISESACVAWLHDLLAKGDSKAGIGELTGHLYGLSSPARRRSEMVLTLQRGSPLVSAQRTDLACAGALLAVLTIAGRSTTTGGLAAAFFVKESAAIGLADISFSSSGLSWNLSVRGAPGWFWWTGLISDLAGGVTGVTTDVGCSCGRSFCLISSLAGGVTGVTTGLGCSCGRSICLLSAVGVLGVTGVTTGNEHGSTGAVSRQAARGVTGVTTWVGLRAAWSRVSGSPYFARTAARR